MKKCLPFVAVFFILIAGYLAFAATACLLPDGPIKRHIEKTVERGDLTADYPTAGIPHVQCRQDNFTDALILNQAWHCSRDSILTSMLLLPRSCGPQPMLAYDCLARAINGTISDHIYYYPRYWHGSTFLMRFLLTAMDYQNTRMLFYLATSLLVLLLCASLCRQQGLWAAALLLTGMVLNNLFVMQLSVQFAMTLIIALTGSIVTCKIHSTQHKMLMLMLVTGSLTAYFDLLTTPLLTLGLPLVVWLLVSAERHAATPLGTALWHTTALGILWSLGYAATWAVKWLVSTLFTSANVFADAAGQMALRSGTADYTRWDALMQNTNLLFWPAVILVLLLLVGLAIYRFKKANLKTSALLVLVSLMPFAWYIVVSNHSYEHCWFTYRNLIITLAAWFLAIGMLIDWNRLGHR